ncbi:unnamed protein product [Mesocestoides corti]|uniref:Uncharacterized protein n=1 Tax=Mesocestoides corti TaxID=53468 RepID=A0A0R3U218_MESCO|nr:unnamed protein product [Mesocestoides corti]
MSLSTVRDSPAEGLALGVVRLSPAPKTREPKLEELSRLDGINTDATEAPSLTFDDAVEWAKGLRKIDPPFVTLPRPWS